MKDRIALEKLRERYTTDSPLSLHLLFPEKMIEHAEQRVMITEVSYYHMAMSYINCVSSAANILRGIGLKNS